MARRFGSQCGGAGNYFTSDKFNKMTSRLKNDRQLKNVEKYMSTKHQGNDFIGKTDQFIPF